MKTAFFPLILAAGLSLVSPLVSSARAPLTDEQIAALPPVDPAAIPRSGSFILLKGPGGPRPPTPCVPGPLLPLTLTSNVTVLSFGDGWHFVIDDRLVDYDALRQDQEMDATLSALEARYGLGASPERGQPLGPAPLPFGPDQLWLELAMTNSTGYFVAHPPETEAAAGADAYDLFMTTNLTTSVPGLNLTNWAWLLRTEPGVTNLMVPELPADEAFFMLAKTNSSAGDGWSDALKRLVLHADPSTPLGPVITLQPFDQTVEWGDTVTFSIVADGPPPLSYQWLLGGLPLAGQTNNSLTLLDVDPSQEGDYSVRVTSTFGLSVVSETALLTVLAPDVWPVVSLIGPRENYTFRNGVTYDVFSRVELYGVTTIQGGAFIKFDANFDSTLAILGTLVCETGDANFPAFLTYEGDGNLGDIIDDKNPATSNNGVPYLDLTCAQDPQPSLSNLRIRYADIGILAPPAKRLDIWDCQFLQCHSAIVAGRDATIALHNDLVSASGAVVTAPTNFAAITGEHLTADVADFWAQGQPGQIALTNCILVGSLAAGPALVTDHTVLNPAGPLFQQVGSGNYYLTNTCSLRRAGATGVSPRLLAEFGQKTTQPPLAFPAYWRLSGDLTLGPQAGRYTTGPPDYGYYYPALDYTVAALASWGNIAVLPGTTIGFRDDLLTGGWTWWGFDLREGSQFTSRATPTKPTTFVDVVFVQDQRAMPCAGAFVPDFWPLDPGLGAPRMDFQFCNFYAEPDCLHFWSGYDFFKGFLYTPCSLADWTMQDCALHGGMLTLGEPDDGSSYGAPTDFLYGSCAVSWKNNLFDNVAIDLDPTLYQYGADDLGLNCDMSFEAYNNLFRGRLWFHLEPVPASAGNWVFKDNLFDKVNLVQDTNSPIDFGFNGYSPLTASELSWNYFYYYWSWGYMSNANQLLPGSTGGGGNEQVLASAPPYQAGPLGGYYLPIATPLYHAGSRTANDAGLFHYTTRVDQIKEGDEALGHMVNIGLHYVAVANGVPKDSDADGIPDFVENWHGDGDFNSHTDSETDWRAAYTVDGIYDPTNSVYDDRDLSGSGLTGRAKRALGLGALNPANPLTLTRVTAGEEPEIATFSTPVNHDALTNAGWLYLRVDGKAPALQTWIAAPGGTSLLKWNVTFDWPGPHFVECQAILDGQPHKGTGPEPAASTDTGPLASCCSENVVRFALARTEYDTNSSGGANLHADLPEWNADYAIELRTPDGQHLRTISGSTTSGAIEENWDLKDDSGNPYLGDSARADFGVTLTGSGKSGTNVLVVNQAPMFAGVYNGRFTVAYAWADERQAEGVTRDCIQGGVVDRLIKPTWAGGENGDPYSSDYNRFSSYGDPGNPGRVKDQTMVTPLVNNLAAWPTIHFHFDGHGHTREIGDDSGVRITTDSVQNALGNIYNQWTFKRDHPYHLVFLNACYTANLPIWSRVFGIYDETTWDDITASPGRDQAFVGWRGAPRAPTTDDEWRAMAQTYVVFYAAWMNYAPLDECIRIASSNKPYGSGDPMRLDFPLGIKFDWTWLAFHPSYDNEFQIWVYGYKRITRGGPVQ